MAFSSSIFLSCLVGALLLSCGNFVVRVLARAQSIDSAARPKGLAGLETGLVIDLFGGGGGPNALHRKRLGGETGTNVERLFVDDDVVEELDFWWFDEDDEGLGESVGSLLDNHRKEMLEANSGDSEVMFEKDRKNNLESGFTAKEGRKMISEVNERKGFMFLPTAAEGKGQNIENGKKTERSSLAHMLKGGSRSVAAQEALSGKLEEQQMLKGMVDKTNAYSMPKVDNRELTEGRWQRSKGKDESYGTAEAQKLYAMLRGNAFSSTLGKIAEEVSVGDGVFDVDQIDEMKGQTDDQPLIDAVSSAGRGGEVEVGGSKLRGSASLNRYSLNDSRSSHPSNSDNTLPPTTADGFIFPSKQARQQEGTQQTNTQTEGTQTGRGALRRLRNPKDKQSCGQTEEGREAVSGPSLRGSLTRVVFRGNGHEGVADVEESLSVTSGRNVYIKHMLRRGSV